MNPTEDRDSYSYLGIQARPPRRKGRDRRRLGKDIANQNEEVDSEVQTQQEEMPVVTDPLSPYVEEFAHCVIPAGVMFSRNRPVQYEYLDNTADIQVHAWGNTFEVAVEQCVLGMYGYISDSSHVDFDGDVTPIVIKAKGHDCLSLLYDVLNEFLCCNSTMDLLFCDVRCITPVAKDYSSVRLLGIGEKYSKEKHKQGTEVKAITYSNMQVLHKEDGVHIYVILDISRVCYKHANPTSFFQYSFSYPSETASQLLSLQITSIYPPDLPFDFPPNSLCFLYFHFH